MKIQGLITATFAAYYEDGSINLEPIPALVEKLLADGVHGIFVNGTNGEGPNLTVEERMAIAEAYVRAVGKRLIVLVHVGHSSIADARRMAAHAESIGADAISAVAAFYFKPGTVQRLVDCMAEIAAAAPGLPFYYYHIPAITSVALDMVDFLALAEPAIPNLAGLKYTAPTIQEYQACLNYGEGKFDILYGTDELLLSALAVGSRGAVGSTYTFAAPLYLRIMRDFAEGKLRQAAELQMASVEMVRRLVKYPPIPAQRAIMKHLGYDLGPCRLPLAPLTEAEAAALIASLEEIDFFGIVEQSR